MKKIITFLLSLTMVFTLAACSTTSSAVEDANPEPELSSDLTEESSSPKSPANALVVYFSMPETADPNNMTQEEDNSVVVIDGEVLGNTQYVAYVIQENTGADIFRIEPETPYPTDHDILVDLAAEEQANDTRPALKSTIENLDQYDTIFVGYPKMEYGFNCVSCI